jgi:hypothetical protein
MNPVRYTIISIVALIILLSNATIVQGQLSTDSNSFYSPGFEPSVIDSDDTSGPVGPLTALTGVNGTTATGDLYDYSSWATIDYGYAQFLAQASVTPSAGSNGGAGTTSLNMVWSDSIIVTPASSALIGTTADWTFTVSVSGSGEAVDPANAGRARSGWGMRFGTSAGGSSNFGATFESSTGYNGTPLGSVSVTVPIVLGVSSSFAGIFSGFAEVSLSSGTPGGERHSLMDLSNTLQWMGTDSIMVDGAPIAFSMSATSGVDWTSTIAPAIPVPSFGRLFSFILPVLLGLLGVSVLARSRSASA